MPRRAAVSNSFLIIARRLVASGKELNLARGHYPSWRRVECWLRRAVLWIWSAIGTFALGFAVSLSFSSPRTDLPPWLVPLALPFLFILAVLTALTWRDWIKQQKDKQQQEEERLHREFAILKDARDLIPEDLGFQVVAPNEQAGEQHRPFSYACYIKRRAAPLIRPRTSPLDDISELPPCPIFTEEMMVNALRESKSLVLVGAPTEGKSRTLYEIIRQLDDYTVIRLSHAIPSDAALSRLEGRKVVLLLDDLNNYVSSPIDLQLFWHECLQRYAESAVLAATCRGGPELDAVEKCVQNSLGRFYEGIALKLSLLPITADEKKYIAQAASIPWDTTKEGFFPTPGTITMKNPLDIMRVRFQGLPAAQQDTLRAMKLLVAGGVLPLTHGRVEAVLEQVFQWRLEPLHHCLEALASQYFVQYPDGQDPIRPEPAYLEYAVPYIEGKSESDDLEALDSLLKSAEDVEGVYYLGLSYGTRQNKNDLALECLNWVVERRPDWVEASYNKAIALRFLGRHAEALVIIEKVLESRPTWADAWFNKAEALRKLGRPTEAVGAYDKVLAEKPTWVRAWFGKALALEDINHFDEAVDAYRSALAVRSDLPEWWFNLAGDLGKLGRHVEEARAYRKALKHRPGWPEAAYNMAISLRGLGCNVGAVRFFGIALKGKPNWPEALHDRAISLADLGRDDEAVTAFEEAIRSRPNWPEAQCNLARVLAKQGKHESVISHLDEAIRLRPNFFEAWLNKGIALAKLQRYAEAIAVLDKAIYLRPSDADAWNSRGLALHGSARYEEALQSFEKAISLEPEHAGAWHNRSRSLAVLHRYSDALASSEKSIHLKPDNANAWQNYGTILLGLHRQDEAIESLCRAWQLRKDLPDRGAWVEATLRTLGHDLPFDPPPRSNL